MRRLLFSVVMIACSTILFAQKELNDIQENISKGKYTEAKEKIDKYLADPKNQKNANAWYYKGKIYTELARLDSTNQMGSAPANEAFEAYRKYQELDPKNIMMTLDQNVGFFQLYDLYYNRGIKGYNQKDYDKAYENLKGAMTVEDYVRSKGYSYNNFSFPQLDTQLIHLTASSAYLAKKEQESLPYFERLAEARIKDKDFKEIYALLAQHYQKAGDQQKAEKYLTLGKELFPDNAYWLGIEMGDVGDDKEKRMARYQEMTQKYPDNFDLNMDYAIELFNYTYSNENKPADYKQRQERLTQALNKALQLNPNSATANYVMTQHLTNEIYDLDDQVRAVKGTAAADVAKRKQLNTQMDKLYDDMYTYSQKAYDLYSADPNLKSQDKINYRKVISQLKDYHTRKKQMDKVAMYDQKLKQLQ